MKFNVDDKNRCRLVCVKFHLNRCRFAVAVAKCLGGSLFWDTVYIYDVGVLGRVEFGILVGIVASSSDWFLLRLRLRHDLQIHLHFTLSTTTTQS